MPVATAGARYGAGDVGPLRTDLRPIEITQPEGPSFTVEGSLVRWQKWSLRLGWDPYEGLVLHQVGYDDGGRTRSILHRASISEMVVPYGDPGEVQGWKNAFDAGEWGLGRMTQSLTLGCDCLGEIHYVDVTMADEQGHPWVVPNAICLHEEDAGHRVEARRHAHRAARGAAQPTARDQPHRHGRQLRVRLLLVPLPRREHPARGQAHRDHVVAGHRAGRAQPVRHHGGRGRGRAGAPAPLLRPARPRRRRGREPGRGGRGRGAAARRRQPLGQRVPRAGHAAAPGVGGAAGDVARRPAGAGG